MNRGTLSSDPIYRKRGLGRTIAIVGAGAVGLTTALDLKIEGANVTVYEADTVASQSSGRAAGVCHTAFGTAPDSTLGAHALDRFHEFAEDGTPFTACPYVWLAQEGDTKRIELIQEGIDAMQRNGVDAERLDRDELTDRFPAVNAEDIAIAGVTTRAGYTDTAAYTEWLAERAQSEGVTIEEQTPVGITTDPVQVVPSEDSGVETPDDLDALVVTAGAHTKQVLADAGIPIAMKPYRVQALVGSVSLEGDCPMVYDASADCYLRPHAEGLLAGDGTEEIEADPDGYQREADETFPDSLAQRVTHRIDCDIDVDRAWAGLCTATPDRDPLVGEIRDNLYIATGFQGEGFMRSPAIGRRLVDDIFSSDGIDAFDPTRFDGDEEFEIREGMAIES
jgi:glycine/D-amino acid oxidase-like deaminating enzyme